MSRSPRDRLYCDLRGQQHGCCLVCGKSLDLYNGMNANAAKALANFVDTHHIVPRRLGGPDGFWNEILIHRRCHELVEEEPLGWVAVLMRWKIQRLRKWLHNKSGRLKDWPSLEAL